MASEGETGRVVIGNRSYWKEDSPMAPWRYSIPNAFGYRHADEATGEAVAEVQSLRASRSSLVAENERLRGAAKAFLDRVAELSKPLDDMIAMQTLVRNNPWTHGDWCFERDALAALLAAPQQREET